MAFRESEYDPKHCDTAIDVLSRGKSLAAVCVEIGVCRKTLYNWRDAHEDFANALNFGLQKAQSIWEDKGERGIDGEIKNFQGSPWMFTMKNRFRADYAEEKNDDGKTTIIEKLLEKL